MIRMVPYKLLYGRRYRSPLHWDEVGERQLLGPEAVREAQDAVALIRKHMLAAQSDKRVMWMPSGEMWNSKSEIKSF